MKEFNWCITKCRAKFKGNREINYTFYILDYVRGEWPPDINITILRNVGAVKTRYFLHERDMSKFIEGQRRRR